MREIAGEVRGRLARPVDVASVATFRVMFGALMLVEVVRYFKNGWIDAMWLAPSYHFHYQGFGWLEPLPGVGMYVLFGALGVAALGITLGAWYRTATTLFLIGFGYAFLLESTLYLNHLYLVLLLAGILVVVPAHRDWSIDARRRPDVRSSTVQAWGLHLLRFQVGVVYFFGGVAKINTDWIAGEPQRSAKRA